MMNNSNRKYIAGSHLDDEGNLSVVWFGYDVIDGSCYIEDCCVFRNEIPLVIADGFNSRGRWIPIAWHKGSEELVKLLKERGCNVLPQSVPDSKAFDNVATKEFSEYLRARRFKTNPRMASWNEQYKGYQNAEQGTEAYPLMMATKHALSQLKYARRKAKKVRTVNYPRLAII